MHEMRQLRKCHSQLGYFGCIPTISEQGLFNASPNSPFYAMESDSANDSEVETSELLPNSTNSFVVNDSVVETSELLPTPTDSLAETSDISPNPTSSPSAGRVFLLPFPWLRFGLTLTLIFLFFETLPKWPAAATFHSGPCRDAAAWRAAPEELARALENKHFKDTSALYRPASANWRKAGFLQELVRLQLILTVRRPCAFLSWWR